MSKHYDPIMCMMVEDKTKVKDTDIFIVEYTDALGDTQKHRFINEQAAKSFYDKTKKDPVYSHNLKLYRNNKEVTDSDPRELKALEEVKKLYSNIQNSNGTKMKDEESYFELMRPKKYKIFGDIVLLKNLTGSTATYTTSNGQTVRIGRRKWDELARKINSKDKRTVDASSIDEFKKTKALCQQIISQYSGTMLGRKVDAHAVIAYANSIIEKMDFYIQNSSKGWYD